MMNIESLVYKINTANGSGSCFYLNQYGVFVTNFHVIEGFKTVGLESRTKDRLLAKVLLVCPERDLAILKTENALERPDLVFHTGQPLATEKVWVPGFPYGMPYCITKGIISSASQVLSGQQMIQIDAAINPGNSGGPVINEQGELIGIVASKFTQADNMGFAIPLEALISLLEVYQQTAINSYAVLCAGCDTPTTTKTAFCPGCGTEMAPEWFSEFELTRVGRFCEQALAKAGMNPVLLRNGHEFWHGHSGSAELRVFVYKERYLYATSPLNKMPKQNPAALLGYLLSNPFPLFQLGVADNLIYLSLRFPLAMLDDEVLYARMQDALAAMALKADELDEYFHDNFQCEKSLYSKEISS